MSTKNYEFVGEAFDTEWSGNEMVAIQSSDLHCFVVFPKGTITAGKVARVSVSVEDVSHD